MSSVGVGLYARISEDPDDTRLGVERQHEDGRAAAKLRGWPISRVYVDNDLSAYKRKVIRPDFEQLLIDLTTRKVDGVVAYNIDRLFRQNTDLERMINIYDDRAEHGHPAVFATVEGDLDLSTADGRTMARVLVAFANKASMDTSRRVARVHLAAARAGRPSGAWRPFGWQTDKTTLHPAEALLVRHAAGRLLAGGTLAGIVADWHAAGIRTTRGNRWLTTTLRAYLLSPRLAGWRVHRKQIATTADGQPVRGLHQPLLDDETWNTLTRLLTGADRTRYAHRGGRTPKAELSGGLLVGSCGASMRLSTEHGRRYYRCPSPNTTRNGCGKCSIRADPLEELIRDLILTQMTGEQVDHQPTPWPRETELETCNRKITELMAAHDSGQLPADIVFPRVKQLSAARDELRAERAEYLREQMRAANQPTGITVEDWERLAADERRALIATRLQTIVIHPATRRGQFDHNRVEPVPYE